MIEMKTFPIAEYFDSIQGEGFWAGTRMFFIRFAGCTVGKPFPHQQILREKGKQPTHKSVGLNSLGPVVLPIYTEMCTIYDGRTFECDTDYRIKEKLTASQIIALIPQGVKHVCLTGGEPLMHDLRQFIVALMSVGYEIHIETSGTIAHSYITDNLRIYVAVSPKFHVLDSMIKRADEIKLLIDDKFDADKLPLSVLEHGSVYIQPINYENDINQSNIKRCIELQQKFPEWILSIQLHKVIKVR